MRFTLCLVLGLVALAATYDEEPSKEYLRRTRCTRAPTRTTRMTLTRSCTSPTTLTARQWWTCLTRTTSRLRRRNWSNMRNMRASTPLVCHSCPCYLRGCFSISPSDSPTGSPSSHRHLLTLASPGPILTLTILCLLHHQGI